jgi:hypothetical protein
MAASFLQSLGAIPEEGCMDISYRELSQRMERDLRALHGLQADIRESMPRAAAETRRDWLRLEPALAHALRRGYEPDEETCEDLERVAAEFRRFLQRVQLELLNVECPASA